MQTPSDALRRAVAALRARADLGPLARLADRLEDNGQDTLGALRVALDNDAGDAAIDALCALRLTMSSACHEGLDPAVVAAVARRAARVIEGMGRLDAYRVSDLRPVLEDLAALTREADEAVERRGPLEPGPFRGWERAFPQWWRDEYREDPLLGALVQMGAPASLALPQVIAAYWSLRGVMVSAAMRATPNITIQAPGIEVVSAAKAAVSAAHPIGGINGPGYVVPEAVFRALAGAAGQKLASLAPEAAPAACSIDTLVDLIGNMADHAYLSDITINDTGHVMKFTLSNGVREVHRYSEVVGHEVDESVVERHPRSGRNLKRVLAEGGEAAVRAALGI